MIVPWFALFHVAGFHVPEYSFPVFIFLSSFEVNLDECNGIRCRIKCINNPQAAVRTPAFQGLASKFPRFENRVWNINAKICYPLDIR